MMNTLFGAAFAIPLFIVWIGMVGLGLYSLILFIKLANKGLVALDIYISKNRNHDIAE